MVKERTDQQAQHLLEYLLVVNPAAVNPLDQIEYPFHRLKNLRFRVLPIGVNQVTFGGGRKRL